jgi:ketosteroid isomerase-like protein
MSQQDVEIVRRVYEAVARRDAAEVLALYDPEVEVDSSQIPEAELTGRRVLRGHEGIRSLYRDWSEAWESFADDCEELIDAGEQVISIVTRRGRGRASGVETTARRAGVWTIREGKVVRVAWFAAVEDALEAAGVEDT